MHLYCPWNIYPWNSLFCQGKYFNFQIISLSEICMFEQSRFLQKFEMSNKRLKHENIYALLCLQKHKLFRTKSNIHVKAPIFFTKTLRGKQWRKLHKHGLNSHVTWLSEGSFVYLGHILHLNQYCRLETKTKNDIKSSF